MTILLKKDGRLIIDADQPIEGVSLDNLAAILAGANDGDVIKYDATNGMWVSGAGGGSLPAVTSSDNGKVLGVVNAQWDTMAAPSSLPAVTAADDGDVLTVVSGAWAKATPSSGGGVLVVGITFNSQTNLYECNKTAGEIWSAYAAGSNVVFSDTEYDDVSSLVYANIDNGTYWFFVGGCDVTTAKYMFSAEASTDNPVQELPE